MKNGFPINETGFPYNPQFTTGVTPLPSLRPLIKRKPDIPIYQYGKLYIPGNDPICPFYNYAIREKRRILQEAKKEEQQKQQAQQEQMQRFSKNQDGEDDDDE